MKNLKKITALLAVLAISFIAFSCNNDDNNSMPKLTPSEILASTPWETTSAKNNKGENVPLTDANVSNFVGFAYFNANGKFNMFNLDDSPKMQGDWSVSPDGKTRTITAKDNFGKDLFTRVVDITVLTTKEFTYRIYPNANDRTVYYDIIHTPTNHKEPEYILYAKILASTAWVTTGAKDAAGADADLATPPVDGFVGYAYYNENGTFKIYGLDDVLRSQGTWSVSADGKTRTLTFANGFSRVVSILTLTNQLFTYRIAPDANTPAVYYDIIHEPTTHTEPAQ